MSLDITPEEMLAVAGPATEHEPLSTAALYVMSIACGVSAANIYYNQPLLGRFAAQFHASPSAAGLVATASQVGYGVGLLLFVPLGDVYERRRIVLILTGICAALLVGVAFSPNLPTLIGLQLAVGMTAMSSQLLIPFAVDLSPAEQRGRTVGALMAGLLIGILGARTVSGFVGDWLGWQWMFGIAAILMAGLAIVLAATLPRHPPTARMGYVKLLWSLVGLLRTQPRLWSSSIISGLSFGVFSAFWTTLSFLMQDHFHRGASEAGAFGLIGIAGAAAAPLAGKLSDRKGPAVTVTASLVATIVAFVIFGAWVSIPGLIIGVLLMDMGVQAVQVAEQSTVMSLLPEARSRMNTLYMVARFIGAAIGSAAGASAWTHGGWTGVCLVGIVMTTLAIAVHAWRVYKQTPAA